MDFWSAYFALVSRQWIAMQCWNNVRKTVWRKNFKSLLVTNLTPFDLGFCLNNTWQNVLIRQRPVYAVSWQYFVVGDCGLTEKINVVQLSYSSTVGAKECSQLAANNWLFLTVMVIIFSLFSLISLAEEASSSILPSGSILWPIHRWKNWKKVYLMEDLVTTLWYRTV